MERLEFIYRIEAARLEVAQSLSWWIAALAATCTYFKYQSFVLSAVLAVGSYLIATFTYRRNAKLALEAYCQADSS